MAEDEENEEEEEIPIDPDEIPFVEDEDFYSLEDGLLVDPEETDFAEWGSSGDYAEEHQRGAYDPEDHLEAALALSEERREEMHKTAIIDRVTAEIGNLTFHEEFANPDVDVTHDRQTAEHEIVSAYKQNGNDVNYVVQTMGRLPPEITVNGWVSEDQLETLDDLLSQKSVEMITDRWTGVAVPINVSTPYERAFHERRGRVFEVTIELLAVSKDLPSDESESNESDQSSD